MMVTRHHNESEQSVALLGKMQEGILYDLRLSVIGKMFDGALVVEHLIDQREGELVLLVFPLLLAQIIRARSRFELIAIISKASQTRS